MLQGDANTILGELLKAHDLDISMEDDWFIPNRSLPAIKCYWHEFSENESGRLDIQVLIEDNLLLEECFAGVGIGRDGFLDALENFAVNSLHVLLAAFWDKNDPEQVVTEQWEIGDEKYIAYIGNFGTRATDGIHPGVPEETFSHIEKAIKSTNLKEQTHWIRIFFCNIGDEQIYEALVDNDDWTEGEKALKNIKWPKSKKYFSVRNFIVLQKPYSKTK